MMQMLQAGGSPTDRDGLFSLPGPPVEEDAPDSGFPEREIVGS
jgi:hypothetical protein